MGRKGGRARGGVKAVGSKANAALPPKAGKMARGRPRKGTVRPAADMSQSVAPGVTEGVCRACGEALLMTVGAEERISRGEVFRWVCPGCGAHCCYDGQKGVKTF